MLLAFHAIYMDSAATGLSSKRNSLFGCLTAFCDADFLNENLSVGTVIVKEASDEILNYVGNTSFGSSGGLILDKNLNILGINFGYFND
jgi:hypothetical protein